MRPLLLALFGGLVFLLALPLVRVIMGLDPDVRYGLPPAPRGILAYLLAIAMTGGIVAKVGQFMYRRD